MSATGARAGGAAHPQDGEEEAEDDVAGAEWHLEMALAHLSEAYRTREPYNAEAIDQAFDHAKQAHRLIFRQRWLTTA